MDEQNVKVANGVEVLDTSKDSQRNGKAQEADKAQKGEPAKAV